MKYLLRDEDERNDCLEAVVRVVTMTGGRVKPTGYVPSFY
jgi:hypothetical protein